MSISPNAAGTSDAAAGVAVDGEAAARPTISLPAGPPPEELVVIDMIDATA